MRIFLAFLAFILLPLQAISAPVVKEIKTENGFNIHAVEDSIIPAVSINIAFRNAGTKADKKTGTANLVASMLNEGAAGISGLEFREILENKAISLNFSYDRDNFYITIKTLKENLEEALELTSLALLKADFAEESLQNIKSQTIAIIKKKSENPAFLAEEKFYASAFKSHAYGKSMFGNAKQLEKIKRQDLAKFVKENFTRKNIIISVTGDFEDENLKQVWDKKFSALPEKYIPPAKRKIISGFSEKNSALINIDAPQTSIIFGLPAPMRDSPDFFPAFILNYIYGGGSFESRLMHEIREKRGLAYGVDTDLNTLSEAGFFIGEMATRSEKAENSIEILKEETKKLLENGITETELESAKKFLTGSFSIGLDSNDKISAFLTKMQLDNLPADYISKRNSYIEEVTLPQVNEVIKQYLKPENLVIISAGNLKY